MLAHPIKTEKPKVEIVIPGAGSFFKKFLFSSAGSYVLQLDVVKGDWTAWRGEVLVIPLFEPEGDSKDKLSTLSPQALSFDSQVDGALSEMISSARLGEKAVQVRSARDTAAGNV